jgi:rubrerythrin
MANNVFDKFDRAEAVEHAAARLYRQLAQRFDQQSDIAKTFRELAGEEDQHALRVRMLRDRYSQKPSAAGEITLDCDAIEGLLAEAALLEELFAREPFTISVEEATRFMMQIEDRFSEAHAHAMASTSSPEVRAFFEMLAKQDAAHARVLASLAQRG